MKKAQHTPHDWSEDKLQSEYFRWFINSFPTLRGCLFSCPNGVNKSGFNAKLFKATGLWAGVADMLLMLNGTTYCLELKRPDGKGGQSPGQKKWEAQMKLQKFEYNVFNDLEELKDYTLAKILENTPTDDMINEPHEQLKLF